MDCPFDRTPAVACLVGLVLLGVGLQLLKAMLDFRDHVHAQAVVGFIVPWKARGKLDDFTDIPGDICVTITDL